MSMSDSQMILRQRSVGAEKQRISSEIEFLVDGYYKITGKADVKNQVKERNEDNNVLDKNVGSRVANGAYDASQIIHIKGTHLKPVKDEKGIEVYVKYRN